MTTNPMRIALLGASGSIGMQTLKVIKQHPEMFALEAFSLGNNIKAAKQISSEFRASTAVICNKDLESDCDISDFSCEVKFGEEYNECIAKLDNVDCVVIAMPGMLAIKPLVAAIKSGKRLAIANKECLVSGGDLVQKLLKQYDNYILPIDSEQSAIFQCLQGLNSNSEVEKLILTASGGPFLEWSIDAMRNASVAEALAHPKWNMGKKISVDSATLVNKGLEVIEAAYLFGVPVEKIEVLIHPQSIVHSMVECCDGAILAQLGTADMTLPIQYALTHPLRIDSPAKKMDFTSKLALDFTPVDDKCFPGLKLAYDAFNAGKSAPAVYNAADEVAVEAFLNNRIGFLDIVELIDATMQKVDFAEFSSIEELFEIDLNAREIAENIINQKNK